MKANSTWSWFKKWGWWILLLLAAGLVLLCWLLPSDGKKPKLLQGAKDGAAKLKDQAEDALREHEAKMQANRDELACIKAIENEEERLQALADFANREDDRV